MAVAGKAALLRKQILAVITAKPATHDEAAALIRPNGMGDVAFENFKRSVRSRCSELKEQSKIEATAMRRNNASGHAAVVWRTTNALPVKPVVSVVTTTVQPVTASTRATQQELI